MADLNASFVQKIFTLRSESGKRTYSITAKRMISGLVLKYLNGARFVIRRGYETALNGSSWFCLTVPVRGKLRRCRSGPQYRQAGIGKRGCRKQGCAPKARQRLSEQSVETGRS